MSDEENAKSALGADETYQKCDQCGGPMHVDAGKHQLVCDYCDAVKKITESAGEAERAFTRSAQKANCDWGAEKKLVVCKVCGAQSVYDAVQISNVCPYCESNQVVVQDDNDTIAPNGICVFKVDKDKAATNYNQWIGSHWLAPSSLRKQSFCVTMQPVFLPHWTFDTNTFSVYKGQFGVAHTETDSNGKEVVKTHWYHTSGSFKHFFDDFLMVACSKQNRGLLESIQPFNTNDYEKYRPELVAGCIAERYSISLEDAWDDAKKRMFQELKKMAHEQISDKHKVTVMNTKVDDINSTFEDIEYKYLLLPVWLSSYRFNGKVYQVMINGQTGKVCGETPISFWKVLFIVLIIVGILVYLFYSPNKGSHHATSLLNTMIWSYWA